jgi:hypothetical protein
MVNVSNDGNIPNWQSHKTVPLRVEKSIEHGFLRIFSKKLKPNPGKEALIILSQLLALVGGIRRFARDAKRE